MVARGTIRRVFPGGNTSEGFFSFYDYLIEPDATRILILKGGPGVGKSTLMKQIAEEMLSRGYDVEMHHCSSDNNSLDGIVIPAIKVAMVDGTAPHIVDPRHPGCVDEIIHLGDYWDEAGMRAGKTQVMSVTRETGKSFARAYRYLRAAKAVHDDWESINTDSLDHAAANRKAADLIGAIFTGLAAPKVAGKVRHLFASAITPQGPVNHLATLIEPCPVKYVITGDPGTGKSTLLEKVVAAAVTHGVSVEAFHCALDPRKLEHVLLPELGVAITVAAEPHVASVSHPCQVIDMNECVDRENAAQYAGLAAYNQRLCLELIDQAVAALARAKKLHDLLETYYIPNMDFAAINTVRERTLARILRYAAEFA